MVFPPGWWYKSWNYFAFTCNKSDKYDRAPFVCCLYSEKNNAGQLVTDLWPELNPGRVTYKSNSSCWCR